MIQYENKLIQIRIPDNDMNQEPICISKLFTTDRIFLTKDQYECLKELIMQDINESKKEFLHVPEINDSVMHDIYMNNFKIIMGRLASQDCIPGILDKLAHIKSDISLTQFRVSIMNKYIYFFFVWALLMTACVFYLLVVEFLAIV